jgi:hypothetical protein
MEKIAPYIELLGALSELQQKLKKLKRFEGDPLTVQILAIVAVAIILQIAQVWAFALALVVGCFGYFCYKRTCETPAKMAKLHEQMKKVYRDHNLQIKRASLVQISGYYCAWVLGRDEIIIFQVERGSLADCREGLVALAGLGVSIADFAIPLKIEIKGSVPACTYHPRISFTARACFLKGSDCETIVRRFHTDLTELEAALRSYIIRHIQATAQHSGTRQVHKAVWDLKETMVEIDEFNAEACILTIGFA